LLIKNKKRRPQFYADGIFLNKIFCSNQIYFLSFTEAPLLPQLLQEEHSEQSQQPPLRLTFL
jgi:hypothetical protein